MKITTATLITMLALGSTFTFAQNGNTVPAKAEVSESYSVTVTTVMRPLIPVADASSQTADVNSNAAADTNAAADANLKFSVTTSEVDRLPADKSDTSDSIAAR